MLFRYVRAVLSATAVTFGLIWVMQALVQTGPQTVVEPGPRGTLGIAEVREDSEIERDRPPEPLPPPAEPPPIRPPQEFETTEPGGGLTVPPPPDTPGPTSHGPLFATVGDGPLVAVVRVQPDYPPRASQQGLEGWVIVEFDVTAAGTVENVRVIESSHGVFERAAIRAAERFRYRARVVDGVPQPTRGLRNRFRFEMERA